MGIGVKIPWGLEFRSHGFELRSQGRRTDTYGF